MADDKTTTKNQGDLGASEVEAKVDEAEEQGFIGTKVDPTPNEHYTVEGVTTGKPTPETDPDAHAEAQAAALGSRFPKPDDK
jgi:hypothetical protein